MSQKAILSKSTFIKGLQCHKQLYLYKHHYTWQDPISKMQQSVFNRGHRVGYLAQTLFPNGIDASPPSPRAYAKAVEYTRELIDKGEKIIYEAAFMFNEVIIYADIIVRNGDKWKVYEVKSSTSISVTNKNDISVQYYVISNSGLDIEDISIIYINNEYVRFGDLDLTQFFKIESLLGTAGSNQEWVGKEVKKLKEVVGQKDIPDIKIGSHCYDPYQCSFIGFCWNHIPENSIFDISKMHRDKKFELYDKGIVNLDEIPEDVQLPESQQLQVDANRTGEGALDKKAISEFLRTFNYPLYFMDFESFQPAIPLFDNSKPYQQIPFQYSLHYQHSKEEKLEHMEFLADAGPDLRIQFIKNLLRDTASPGQIVVYNKSYEIMILNVLANEFPLYKNELEERIQRIVDLMVPFQKKWYYLPEMKGSYSIKVVLPALVPELSYEGLEISDGGSASIAYEKLSDENDMFKIEETRNNLLEYCKLDTLAMVKILRRIMNYEL